MAKIKLEGENVVVLYTELGGGLYDIAKNYKIDLTNKKHFLIKQNEDIEIDWDLTLDDEKELIQNLLKEVSFKIENNYIVIHSAEKNFNFKEAEKMKNFLNKNKIIYQFLIDYKI